MKRTKCNVMEKYFQLFACICYFQSVTLAQHYNDGPVPGCGGFLNVTEAVQTVTSPLYPDDYENSLNCEWRMVSPQGSRIWMNISNIDIETHSTCVYDVLTLYDSPTANGTALGTFCGRVGNPQPLTTTRNSGAIKFTSDFSGTGGGFSLQYKSELFQIYINDQQVVDGTLRLVNGTKSNMSCVYRNRTYSVRWTIKDIPVYYRDPLYTKSLQLSNAGEYTCESEGHRRTIMVDVLYPPANVTILGPDVVESDDHLELACSANANPAPTFAWTEDLLTTENGSTVSTSRDGNRSFVCNVQNKMVPTFGDTVFSSTTARKSVRFEGYQKDTVSSNGGLIAAAVLGWIVAVVVSSLAIAKYLRERNVSTKLQNELEKYKKTEFSRPLLRNAMDTQKAPQAIQLSNLLESDGPGAKPSPPERPAQTLPTEGKPQPQYLDLDSPEKDDRVESGADYTYEDVEKRPDEQRYDDLDESAMDNTRQTDGYEEPIRMLQA